MLIQGCARDAADISDQHRGIEDNFQSLQYPPGHDVEIPKGAVQLDGNMRRVGKQTGCPSGPTVGDEDLHRLPAGVGSGRVDLAGEGPQLRDENREIRVPQDDEFEPKGDLIRPERLRLRWVCHDMAGETDALRFSEKTKQVREGPPMNLPG
jgi:hypothetical protein